ncbi:SH3 domain-containing protein [Marinobacterium sp. YM272]|uniref:SH3 domain-containing protein n=1 Tax=Marinobacterium sp. YM272 TaxID=3421654 RepID=UPI003D7F439A
MKRIHCALAGLAALLLCLPHYVLAGIQLDIETELRLLEEGGQSQRYIPAAEFRAATFTYEDPDGTGWGEEIGRLMGHEILMNSGVYSLGVLKYEGQLAPQEKGGLSYFDKVERLAEAQQVTLSVWGVIRHTGNAFQIDTYAQISPSALKQYLQWQLPLPKAMGGGTLQAHLRPDRIRVQSLSVDATAMDDILSATRRLATLRASPRRDAAVVGELPQGQVHYVLRREGDWALLQIPQGPKGWVPVSGYCLRACKHLLEAARFSGGVLSYMASHKLQNASDHLTNETLAVEEQIKALDGLNNPSAEKINKESLQRAERWVGPERWTGKDEWTEIDRGSGIAPGGASFANIRSLAKLAIALQHAYEDRIETLTPEIAHIQRRLQSEYGDDWRQHLPERFSPKGIFDGVALRKEFVEQIAFELADSSLYDPRNTDVLTNLAMLFGYVGDTERSQLAQDLYEKYAGVLAPAER